MPRLVAASRQGECWRGRAVMPARTNPNHVSLLTGVYPEAHGIVGNAAWDRVSGHPPGPLDSPAAIEVETVFTTIERRKPELVTVGVFAKEKLVRLFSEVPGRQRAPDELWGPGRASAAGRDPATGYAYDWAAMDAFLALTSRVEPDLAVVNLADVDRTEHRFGPESPQAARAVKGADAQIGRLIDVLKAKGRWSRSVLFVTSDHGATPVRPLRERPYPVISFGRELLRARVRGVVAVGDGSVEHIYLDPSPGAQLSPEQERTLAGVRSLALATAGVAEALYRRPSSLGGPTILSRHPDWHLDHPRTGDLFLVAARGFHFVDPFRPSEAALLGDHGGPGDRAVPFVVAGGFPQLGRGRGRKGPGAASAVVCALGPSVEAVDFAPTAAALLGLHAPQGIGGRAVPARESGRVLYEAFVPGTLPEAPQARARSMLRVRSGRRSSRR